MKRILWRVSVGLLLLISLIVLINQELLLYAIGQAKGQIRIIWNAQPISACLDKPDLSDEWRSKLNLIEEIRSFAFDSLSITHSDNYTTLFDQKGEELMWVVTACEPFELKPKEWKFPVIGSFSYKGFFSHHKAQQLEEELKESGLDTNIRTAGGWSTLGWFKDPVLSNMLKRSEGDLAELIIHELTHGTIFVKDSLQFNENLASFIGAKGAELFLQLRFGKDSNEYNNYINSEHDHKKFSNHILRGTQYLDSVYHQIDLSQTLEDKMRIKKEAFTRIFDNIDTLSLVKKERYLRYISKIEPNNTFFMSYLRYQGELEKLEQEFLEIYSEDIGLLLAAYKKRYPSL